MSLRKFAFLVHPRTHVSRDFARFWSPLGRIPDSAYDLALRKLPIPTITWNTLYLDDQPDEPAGWVLLVPLGARQMLEEPRTWVASKIESAVDKAVDLGAEIVGLGALTAPVMRGGLSLRHREDVDITNGNAFTAYATYEALEQLVNGYLGPDAHIAVVGASGSVGSCVVQLAAQQRLANRFTLVARNMNRLERVAGTVRDQAPNLHVTATNEMMDVRQADLVLLLTSATDNILRSEHLKEGAIVLDDTQPRNTRPSLLQDRPDVRVLDGGVVATDGVRRVGADLGIPDTCSYACLSETILLGLEGHEGHFSMGRPTVEQAVYTGELAKRYRRFGFSLAPFQSFGRPVEMPETAPAAAVL